MGKILTLALLSLALSACERPNSKPTYGDTGLPKNCRAIITENVSMYYTIAGQISNFNDSTYGDNSYQTLQDTKEFYQQQLVQIDGIMDSIHRNCGKYGSSWEFD